MFCIQHCWDRGPVFVYKHNGPWLCTSHTLPLSIDMVIFQFEQDKNDTLTCSTKKESLQIISWLIKTASFKMILLLMSYNTKCFSCLLCLHDICFSSLNESQLALDIEKGFWCNTFKIFFLGFFFYWGGGLFQSQINLSTLI